MDVKKRRPGKYRWNIWLHKEREFSIGKILFWLGILGVIGALFDLWQF